MWYKKKKKKKYRVEYEDYIFEYDTKEFDEFNEVRWAWKG